MNSNCAQAVERETTGPYGRELRPPAPGKDGRNAGPHRPPADDQIAVAFDNRRKPDGDARHIGDRVPGSGRDWLTVLGVPVGRHLREDRLFDSEQGSIIAIVGTDIPTDAMTSEDSTNSVAMALISGFTPRRSMLNMNNGRVVEPTPAMK